MQREYVNVRENLENGEYKNNKPYELLRVNKQIHKEYEDEENRIYNQFKQDLFDQDGVSGPKAEKCFRLAWEHGHSSGYYEVLIYWNDFVELIKED